MNCVARPSRGEEEAEMSHGQTQTGRAREAGLLFFASSKGVGGRVGPRHGRRRAFWGSVTREIPGGKMAIGAIVMRA
jgi:hypothetical protein